MTALNKPELTVQRQVSSVYIIVGSLLCGAGILFTFFILFVLSIGINSDGSAELAAKWRNEMSSWDSPSEAAIDSTVSIYDFSNGEWAIMKSKNSHGVLVWWRHSCRQRQLRTHQLFS